MSVNTTVTSNKGTFDGGILPEDQMFSFSLNEAGTHLSSCTIHTCMHGEIIVVP